MTGGPRILIVEDDQPMAEMAAILLTEAGCKVSVAHTGKRGIELASQNKFDLITLDVSLPDINGLEICRELKQRHISRQTPVVFVSGQSYEQRGFALGAVDFIAKPFKTLEFAPRLLSHIKATKTPSDIAEPIMRNAEFGLAKVLHGIADKVL